MRQWIWHHHCHAKVATREKLLSPLIRWKLLWTNHMYEDHGTVPFNWCWRSMWRVWKKNICQFVMAEWDRLVERCSNDLPVTVSEKLIDGSFESCFCCIDSPSIEVINLPCCKASVHRHCVLEALQSNNQCIYCRKVLDHQDIIDCTPQPKEL